jgi:transcriptional regulator with PAS, ATPase and Fis domain
MNAVTRILVLRSSSLGEVEELAGMPVTPVRGEDLVGKNDDLFGAVVLIDRRPDHPALVQRCVLLNPGVHVILCHEDDAPPRDVAEYLKCGVAEAFPFSRLALELPRIMDLYEAEEPAAQLDYYQQLIRKFRGMGIITNNLAMAESFAIIEKVAASGSTVLLYGESGTGKELVARSIHELSERRHHRFIGVNTGAMPENLLEDELFGHIKGSFTSAMRDRKGKFEYADHGTIFLDEISNMPPSLQVKLLRVLQERELERIGDNQTVAVDVRIISATNKRLEDLVARGEFREDLYYRLNVIPLELPPLRHRQSDVPLLANYFIAKFSAATQRPIKSFTLPALRLLQGYSWPGNIRQLENVVERMMVLHADRPVFQPQDLPAEIRNAGLAA